MPVWHRHTVPLGKRSFRHPYFSFPFPFFRTGNVDLANWMAQTPGVSSLMVDEMAWPGTHDTGANSYANLNFDVQANSVTATQQWKVFSSSKFTVPSFPISPAAIQQLLANISINHPGQTVYDQLMNGARFLDIRIARSIDPADTTFYLTHTFVVGNLSDALEDILRYTEGHQGEVLLLKIQPKFNINSYNETMELMDYVLNYRSASGVRIRDRAFIKQMSKGNTYTQCGTIGSLVSSNKRLILTYDTSSTTSGPLAIDTWFFWRQAFYTDNWMGRETVSAKYAVLLADIRRVYTVPNNGRVYNVQFILTPNDPPPGQLLPIGAPSLSELSSRMNPTLESFVFTMMNRVGEVVHQRLHHRLQRGLSLRDQCRHEEVDRRASRQETSRHFAVHCSCDKHQRTGHNHG